VWHCVVTTLCVQIKPVEFIYSEHFKTVHLNR